MATPPQPAGETAPSPTSKPIHSLVLDTGPLIKNDPPVSVLLAKAEQLYTIPSVIPEIRDPATRSRVETTLLPFVTVRAPKPDSIRFVQGFARRTGDLAVLSRPDLEVLALGYELECERNGGDWRLRNLPGQKRLNGRPNQAPAAGQESNNSHPSKEELATAETPAATEHDPVQESNAIQSGSTEQSPTLGEEMQSLKLDQPTESQGSPIGTKVNDVVSEQPKAEEPRIDSDDANLEAQAPTDSKDTADEPVDEASAESDDEGWITPSNVQAHRAADSSPATAPSQPVLKTLQAAILTSDFAMQNVALRMNLNLLSPTLSRITHLKTWVLRCHGCFTVTKDMARQFCPSCGQPTLLRTSCSTDDHGNFTVHLKKNFQWNKRGNVFSVPKPTHGTSNGKVKGGSAGGGKNGWGKELIFAEDQKEYTRKTDDQRRQRNKDIMDQDYLPGILGGDRPNAGGKIRVGAGRNVNGKKKR
ncbi:hypothetical protein S40285_05082 [Stachybotrys chlorohalonatus IBT 40285]|uniref:20S-pre-rRNA D-site endonuclease NOB1 n=1 Tax=Stachybotrys chlorohalonatus (strain IBT 40285) TaxID=1283841 RepID=A0A084QQI2_STAC4|nr:hypothetical protein S40285_05082 [Stachybotrys chlorohalonata IBT 40285]